MTSFSQREAIDPRKQIQVESMDNALRNSLWNVFVIFWKIHTKNRWESELRKLVNILWLDFFKEPLDDLDDFREDECEQIRQRFFGLKWNRVYEFVEFVANNLETDVVKNGFVKQCNTILERETSAYRFVNRKITPITSEEEISEVEKALQATESLKGVRAHLGTALNRLTDRKSPDYRNSIKESISAVEALCKLIAKDKNAKLGQALKTIEKSMKLHCALKKAFASLYGYTSNADGIRHALLDEPNSNSEDAMFMVVACSAFINYLIAKTSKAGIRI